MLPGKKLRPVDIFSIAKRRAVLLIVPVVICTFASLVVSALLKNIYQAEMLIQTIPARVPESFVRSTVTIKTAERLSQVTEQVTSRTRIEQLITELDLYAEQRGRLPMQDVVNLMRRNIHVDIVLGPRNQPTDSFTIRFQYPDARIAAQVTDRLGSMFVNENARDRGALADETSAFLDSQLATARAQLEAQEQKLEQFRQAHAGKLPSQLEFNMTAIQSAQGQVQTLVESLARDRDRRLILERLYNDAQTEPLPVPVAAPSVVTAPSAQSPDPSPSAAGTARQQLTAARSTLERLELRLRPDHPDIRNTKRIIAELEKQVQEETAATIAANPASAAGTAIVPPAIAAGGSPEAAARRERLREMKADIDTLNGEIKIKESEELRLRGVVSDYQSRIEAVPGLESEWVSLTRDYQTIQNTYTDLLGKSEQSKVAAELERRQIGERFRVLDAARVPSAPVSPVRIQINAIGFGIGLLIGLALCALLELRDTSFRTESDILEVLSLPVVALVPIVETRAEERVRLKRRRLASAAVGLVAVAGGYVFWVLQLWKHVV
jgi:polysaccharide chain length determinant protein (PEP-CTERM system associated)